jgi:adenine phosphoribosyltransferase
VAIEGFTTLIRDIPDFPAPGIVFKDLTPVLSDPAAFASIVDGIADTFVGHGVDRVLGIEARGFLVAAPVAYRLGAGLALVRKPGKLPWTVEQEAYTLEYGADHLEIHADALGAGDRVLIVDDVLATGGTAAAAIRLVERLGAQIVGLGFILELGFLDGRARLGEHHVHILETVS